MRILTYGSFGAITPKTIKNYIDVHEANRADPGLIDLVMSFKNNVFQNKAAPLPTKTDEQFRVNADKLFFLDEQDPGDGIRRYRFAGWSDNGLVARVTVNEFDEKITKTVITEYDGAERLSVLPEYAPVPEIPGLYETKT